MHPQHADFLALALPINMDFMHLPDALSQDPYTKDIIEALQRDFGSQPGFHLADEKLFYQTRLVIPDDATLSLKLLAESHDSLAEDTQASHLLLFLAPNETRCEEICSELHGLPTK